MRWVLAWSLFWLGDGVSRIMYGPLGRLYPVYNWLMLKSSKVQGDRVGRWPWSRVIERE